MLPAEAYDEVDRHCPRLPLSYFEQAVAVPDGWAMGANAYLAFGDTAVAEAALDLFARLS